jgi:hypothetical protein
MVHVIQQDVPPTSEPSKRKNVVLNSNRVQQLLAQGIRQWHNFAVTLD